MAPAINYVVGPKIAPVTTCLTCTIVPDPLKDVKDYPSTYIRAGAEVLITGLTSPRGIACAAPGGIIALVVVGAIFAAPALPAGPIGWLEYTARGTISLSLVGPGDPQNLHTGHRGRERDLSILAQLA